MRFAAVGAAPLGAAAGAAFPPAAPSTVCGLDGNSASTDVGGNWGGAGGAVLFVVAAAVAAAFAAAFAAAAFAAAARGRCSWAAPKNPSAAACAQQEQ